VELLNAFLAGFFLWLLTFHWTRRYMAQARRQGGDLVLRVNAAGRWPRRVVQLVCGVLSVSIFATVGVSSHDRSMSFFLLYELTIATQFWMFLAFLVPRGPNTAIEVRERGILHDKGRKQRPPGRLWFALWQDISRCRWRPTNAPAPWHPRQLFLMEDAVTADQKAAVTAAVGRFVPVLDHDGALLAEPEEGRRDQTPPEPCRNNFRFQFDLQSMLILVVVVACLANCYGLRYRRLQPQRQAIAKIETLGPQIDYVGEEARGLDFSSCAKKPADADLALLEPLPELRRLNLSGAPITDAGLIHLKRLKNLVIIDLTNTKVTPKGVSDLQRALPGTVITANPTAPAGTP
jgi:hypothetical protein